MSTTVALVRGQHVALAGTAVAVVVDVGAAAELAALLVTEAGRVRSDRDLVFYNQPAGPGVRLATGLPRLEFDLNNVPPGVQYVRAVVTLVDPAERFDGLAPPVARVLDNTGVELCRFTIDGLADEPTVIALELCRRRNSWVVGAVGEGYSGGFENLVVNHGVTVDPEPPPGTLTAAPLAALDQGRPATPPAGEQVTLRKDDHPTLTRVQLSLGWDPVRRGSHFGNREAEIDLDASAVLFADHTVVDLVFFNQLSSRDGAVVHQGDNLTGNGEGDDEVILVDLTRLPVHVTSVVFLVTSFEGHTFGEIAGAFCRLLDRTTGAELALSTLSGATEATGLIVARLLRVGREWTLEALGQPITVRDPRHALTHLGSVAS